MAIADHVRTTAQAMEPRCDVLLTSHEWRLLEACVAWHARVHTDPAQRREFAALTERLRDLHRRTGQPSNCLHARAKPCYKPALAGCS
jgi:hypothetical protein